jgi:hypothetical protein
LNTQTSELKEEVKQVNTLTNTFTPTPASSGTGKFKQWHLKKIDNKEEFNIIVKDGKNYYWCDQDKYPLSDTQGMYVFHKPTENESWLACETALSEQRGKGSKAKPTISALVSTPICNTKCCKVVCCKVPSRSINNN